MPYSPSIHNTEVPDGRIFPYIDCRGKEQKDWPEIVFLEEYGYVPFYPKPLQPIEGNENKIY